MLGDFFQLGLGLGRGHFGDRFRVCSSLIHTLRIVAATEASGRRALAHHILQIGWHKGAGRLGRQV